MILDAKTVLALPEYIDTLNKFKAYFCYFCSDYADPKDLAICIHCGSLICVATRIGGSGCIGAGTINVDRSKFECPICIGTTRTTTTVIPYYLAGSGLCRTAKIPWPLLLITIPLKNLESLVLKLVQYTMESNYCLATEHVSFFEALRLITHSFTKPSYTPPMST